MPQELPPSVLKFKKSLLDLELEQAEIFITSDSTRTSQDAAQAVGCDVGQIAKSLIFQTKKTAEPILIIASGKNMVDTKKIGKLLGQRLTKARADFVRDCTGYAIGGIPPFGHLQKITTFLDKDLWDYQDIWAAAGTPHAVFKLTPDDLERTTQGRVENVRLEK